MNKILVYIKSSYYFLYVDVIAILKSSSKSIPTYIATRGHRNRKRHTTDQFHQ